MSQTDKSDAPFTLGEWAKMFQTRFEDTEFARKARQAQEAEIMEDMTYVNVGNLRIRLPTSFEVTQAASPKPVNELHAETIARFEKCNADFKAEKAQYEEAWMGIDWAREPLPTPIGFGEVEITPTIVLADAPTKSKPLPSRALAFGWSNTTSMFKR